MAITISVLNQGAGGGGTSQVTGSVTLTSGRLHLMTVVNTQGSLGPDATTPTCTGWTQITTLNYFNDAVDANRVTVFRRAGDGSSGTHTIDFGSATQGDVLWSIEQCNADADATGTNGSNGIVQIITNTGNSTTPSATLGAFGSASNATHGAFGLTVGSNTIAPGTGFTELGSQNEGAPFQCTLFTEYRSDNDTSVDATAGGAAAWGVIALEIKAASTAPNVIAWLTA